MSLSTYLCKLEALNGKCPELRYFQNNVTNKDKRIKVFWMRFIFKIKCELDTSLIVCKRRQ